MTDINTATDNRIPATHIEGSGLKWRLRLEDPFDAPDDGLFLELENQSNGHLIKCPVINVEVVDGAKQIEADLSHLTGTIQNCKTEKWSVSLSGRRLVNAARMQGQNEKKTKGKDPFRQRLADVGEPVGQIDFEGRIVEFVPECDAEGNWIVATGEKCLRYMSAFKCIGLDAGFKSGKAFFKTACPVIKGFEPKGMVVSYKYQLEKDREDHFFSVTSVVKEKDRLTATTVMDLAGIVFRPLFWDIRMVFERDGEEYWSNIKAPGLSKKASKTGSRRARLQNLVRTQTINVNDGYQLSVSETPYNNSTFLVQQDNPYFGLGFRLKERLALAIYTLFRRKYDNKKIFLVHEKFCSAAQDNGWFFFKYCMEAGAEATMGRSIYYVIDKSKPDYIKLAPYKEHVIQFMSLKHMIYSLAARLIISSESKLHSYAWRASESIIRPRVLGDKKNVFLQHGVIGMKRVDAFRKGLPADADLFITSNDMERGFIIDGLDYPPEEVIVTGLSRWDVLEDRSSDTARKSILLMPTWRKWLDETSDEFFLSSEYYQKYMQLINAPGLADFLERNDLYLNFYIHPKLSDLLKQFTATSDRICLIPFGSEPLNELMMECRMLVTDYSSVAWDVYYQAKPVVFYQFDLAEYNETQGAYMDLERDLFGDRAGTQDELLALLEEAASNGFKLKPEYAKMREGLYKYIDHNNSQRICEEIMKRGW